VSDLPRLGLGLEEDSYIGRINSKQAPFALTLQSLPLVRAANGSIPDPVRGSAYLSRGLWHFRSSQLFPMVSVIAQWALKLNCFSL